MSDEDFGAMPSGDGAQSNMPVPITATPVAEPSASVESLRRSVGHLKIWLGILTAVLVLSVLASCGALALVGFTFFGPVGVPDMRVPKEEVDSTSAALEEAYAGQVAQVTVRTVELDYGAIDPFEFLGASGVEEGIAVECELTDPAVVIADFIPWAYGEDVYSVGMIPAQGTMRNRLEKTQVDALMRAYAEQTDRPIGSMMAYTGRDPWMYSEDGSIPETAWLDGEEYPTEGLWTVTTGLVVDGATLDTNSPSTYNRTTYVFREDAETGEWEFLGTEPGNTMF